MSERKVLVPLFLAVLVGVTLLGGGSWGRERILFAIFGEAGLLTVLAPLRIGPWLFFGVLGAGALAITILSAAVSPGLIGSVLLAQLVIGTYAGFLRSLASSLSLAFGEKAGPLAAALVGFALLASPLWIDPILQIAERAGARSFVLHAALTLNPPAAVSYSLFGVDWIREGSLYERARFASTDRFIQPSWSASAILFLTLWAAVSAPGALSRRRSRGRGGESSRHTKGDALHGSA